MKIFPVSKIVEIDKYTVLNEPISDIDLMERAASKIAGYIIEGSVFQGDVFVFCGPGNNGGDGLAVARMLADVESRFSVSVFIFDLGKKLSGSPAINYDRLILQNKASAYFIKGNEDFNVIKNETIIIDALFGSGLNRPLESLAASLVRKINNLGAPIISIDVPSGLLGEDNSLNKPENIICAQKTITFQFPKLSFFFPENERFVGKWEVVDIGLHPEGISSIYTPYYFYGIDDIKKFFKKRGKFSHKGNFGHAYLISGKFGKTGAAILSSKACLKSGVGLLTTHLPVKSITPFQIAVPEAMTCIDESEYIFTGTADLSKFNAIGIGPAIGDEENTQKGLKSLLEKSKSPLVLDADAINILSLNKEWLSLLPENAILTPHPKEFARLAGESAWCFDRIQKAVAMAKQYHIFFVMKGAYTSVVCPSGEVWFNSTGNPGMATAGSGDVLTGIILGFLAQGYSSKESAIAGVFVHGLAGDIAKVEMGETSLIASDIINKLGEAFKMIE